MRFRTFLSAAMALAAVACSSGSTPTGPGSASDPIVGTWDVTEVGGYALPATFSDGGEALTIEAFACTYQANHQLACATASNGANSVEVSGSQSGSWTKNGSTYEITGTLTLGQAQISGAGRGTITAGQFNFVDEDGVTWVYVKR